MADRFGDDDEPLLGGDSEPGAVFTDPERVGPYAIVRTLGEGGMGVVYLAEQREPVRRQVALKLIKIGMDTREVLVRFEAERQALALMNHTAIARVYDAGNTEAGRPWIAMEYVPGVPITEYCDAHRLDLRERLEVFVRVCEGVQHAHQKGVIHRDLKPNNILVLSEDGRPVPKIIDFGIAKALSKRLVERTLFTRSGQIVGTPEYMSPEQAAMTEELIDTRTDVYSLGVLLYELMVGALPFDAAKIRDAAIDEMVRMIREDEPPRPSARVTGAGDDANDAARHRRTDCQVLAKQLRGDLDWIALRALEKSVTRRYASASELAADVTRHLNDEPVTARPPSATYQIGKLIRRHRVPFALSVALVGLLLATVATLTVQTRRIARERDRANLEAETASRTSGFLVDMLETVQPERSLGREVTVEDVLDSGASRVASQLRDEPRLQARLMLTIGTVYLKLGSFERARGLLEDSLELRRRTFGPEHVEVSNGLIGLADLLLETGAYDRAEASYREALAIRERVLDPTDVRIAEAHNKIAGALYFAGEYDGARSHLDRALAIEEAGTTGPRSMPVGESRTLSGAIAFRLGDHETAEAEWSRCVAIREEALGPDHPALAMALNNLGAVLRSQGRLEEARSALERAIVIQEKVLGPNHVHLAAAFDNLGDVLRGIGNPQAARALFERSVEIRRTALGEEHPEFARSVFNLGESCRDAREYDRAIEHHRRALDIRRRVLGDDHVDTAWSHLLFGQTLLAAGRGREALDPLSRAVEIWRAKAGPDQRMTLWAESRLGTAYEWIGRLDEAEPLLARSAERLEAELGTHLHAARSAFSLARLRWRQERYPEAETWFRKALAVREALHGRDHVEVAECLDGLGIVLEAQGRLDEAESAFRRQLAIVEAVGNDARRVGEAHFHLACVAASRGDAETAMSRLRRALALGWVPPRGLEHVGRLASLRGHPGFSALAGAAPSRQDPNP